MTQLTDNGVFAAPIPADATDIVLHNDPPKLVFSSKTQDPAQCGGDMITLPTGFYEFLFCTKGATISDIVKVVEGVDSEGRGYIFMNYVKGMYVFAQPESSLRSLLRSKGCDDKKNYAIIKATT